MPYTVNQLAKLSGVIVRTLYYYDEIELLKPSFLGEITDIIKMKSF